MNLFLTDIDSIADVLFPPHLYGVDASHPRLLIIFLVPLTAGIPGLSPLLYSILILILLILKGFDLEVFHATANNVDVKEYFL